MDTIAVIMVSYHTGPALWPAIEAVLEQSVVSELVLVDNGNSEEVLQKLKIRAAQDPRLQVLTGHGNVGFAKGCNLGVAASRAPFLLFLNPDTVLASDAGELFLTTYHNYPHCTMIGGQILNLDGSEQRGGRRHLLTPWTALLEMLPLGFLRHMHPVWAGVNLHLTPPPKNVCAVPAISGACMFIPRARYHEIGGFDEGYFLHVEDMDLCMAIHQQGGTILYNPAIRLLHHQGTSDAPSKFIEYNKLLGFQRYLSKYFNHYPRILLFFFNNLLFLRYHLRNFRK